MWSVPFVDLAAGHAELGEELDAAWRRVIASSGFILGEEVGAFERDFAAVCGTEHAVGVASGFDALHLILFEAARAALSERDQYARTHRGVLHLLRETFVLREGFPKELHRAAQTAREQREDAHYGAAGAGAPEAAETVDAAERFLAEVERRVGGS